MKNLRKYGLKLSFNTLPEASINYYLHKHKGKSFEEIENDMANFTKRHIKRSLVIDSFVGGGILFAASASMLYGGHTSDTELGGNVMKCIGYISSLVTMVHIFCSAQAFRWLYNAPKEQFEALSISSSNTNITTLKNLEDRINKQNGYDGWLDTDKQY